MSVCYFCKRPLLLNEERYTVRWQPAKFKKWLKIGEACEKCGEIKMCNITSKEHPL